jgi:hypothetical protein
MRLARAGRALTFGVPSSTLVFKRGTLIGRREGSVGDVKGLIVITTAIATLLIGVVAVAAPATTLTGTSEWSDGTFTDPATVTAVHGTFDGTLGKGTYEGTLTGGASFTSPNCDTPVCQPVTGAITFSGHRGSFTGIVQPGSIVAIFDIHPRIQSRTFTLTLRVTGGTRGYTNADGLLILSYTSTRTRFFDDNFQLITTISDSGSLTGDLR